MRRALGRHGRCCRAQPLGLAETAARAALADSGAPEALAGAIDRLIFVRTMLDSVPGIPQPFGKPANLPAALAERLAMTPARAIYSVVGGDSPRRSSNEAAETVFAGEARAVLLVGCEATAAMKTALKAGHTLDWSADSGMPMEDRGLGRCSSARTRSRTASAPRPRPIRRSSTRSAPASA